MAAFSELLALLIDQEVPAQEAVVLAADASGNRCLSATARQFAGRLEAGEPVGPDREWAQLFPPLLGWLLSSGLRGSGLAQSLQATAETYRQRAERSVRWASLYLPILLTVTIGGTATLIQAVVVFGPVFRLLYGLSQS
jgi:type II secretory pathway component PulF